MIRHLRSMPLAGLMQFARFGASGVVVTLLSVTLYWIGAEIARIDPLAANMIAYLGCVVVGYILHSRWSFSTDRSVQAGWAMTRYVLASLASVALNSIWVWLLVERLGGPTWWPIVPMIFATPPLTFVVYRTWVFAQSGARSSSCGTAPPAAASPVS